MRHSAGAGFRVLQTADASDALSIYIYEERTRRIDLVMTDMGLPGRSGLQLGEDLREHSSEVVVLVTSGYTNPEYEIEASELRTYSMAKTLFAFPGESPIRGEPWSKRSKRFWEQHRWHAKRRKRASFLRSRGVPCGVSLCSRVTSVVMILVVNSSAARQFPQ